MHGIVSHLHARAPLVVDVLAVRRGQGRAARHLSRQMEILSLIASTLAYAALVVQLRSGVVLTGNVRRLRGNSGTRTYDHVENGVVLLVDGPDETTTNTAGRVDRSVDVLLPLTSTVQSLPCGRTHRSKGCRANCRSLWGRTANPA